MLEPRRLMSGYAHHHIGIGALGDSYTDEYQFYPPDRSKAENFVEQLAHGHVDFGKFTRRDRGTPRHAGYAFNWAEDGDTSSDMISDGQVAGLRAQAAEGEVDRAFIFIGGDDFLNVFTSANPTGALKTVVPTALKNLTTAIDTLLAANAHLKVVVATVPKVSVLPEVKGAIAAGLLPQQLADGVDQTITAFDTNVKALAQSSNRIALADVDGLLAGMFAKPTITFGGVTINRDLPSDSPTSLFLADGIHAGTIAQGVLGNLFVNAADAKFGDHLRPLSVGEILRNAGLGKCVSNSFHAAPQNWPSDGDSDDVSDRLHDHRDDRMPD
jgi:hypothetical protein